MATLKAESKKALVVKSLDDGATMAENLSEGGQRDTWKEINANRVAVGGIIDNIATIFFTDKEQPRLIDSKELEDAIRN